MVGVTVQNLGHHGDLVPGSCAPLLQNYRYTICTSSKIVVCLIINILRYMIQYGRSRVRFPIVSLEFFIDIILPAALWPWG
jgi:hypothetical protein